MREDAEPVLAVGHAGDRHPGGGVGISHVDGGAGGLRHVEPVAGIGCRRRRQVFAAALHMRIGLGDALLVMREAAAGERHAIFRTDAELPVGTGRTHTDNLAALAQQLLRRAGREDRHADRKRRLRKPRRERIAARHVDPAAVERKLLHVRGEALRDIEERGQRFRRAEEVLEVRVRRIEHHAHEGDRLERRLEARHVLAQSTDVVGRGENRAADVDAAPDIRVIVRVERRDEFHLGLALEKLDHLRAVLDEALDSRGVVIVAGLVHHIPAQGFDRVAGILLAPVFVERNPEHAARKRRRSAEHRLLLKHDDIEAALARSDRGGETRRAGTDHDEITGNILGHAQSPGVSVQPAAVALNPGRGTMSISMQSRPPSTSTSAPLT